MHTTLKFHGAIDGVTGSCHQLFNDDESILIDCGIFQGKEARRQKDLEIDFDISNLKALVITHVHIDHIGRIPYLLAAGYKGHIYTSVPTAYLLPEQLDDAIKIGFTRNKSLVRRVIDEIKRRIIACEYKEWITVSDRFRIKLYPAGHILGSAFVCVEMLKSRDLKRGINGKRKRVLFSGDLGAPYTPILNSPHKPCGADLLVLESTYGNRKHDGRKERRSVLLKLLKECVSDNGIVLIPSFAIGRTQELLYELNDLIESGRLQKLSVLIDSPLADKFTEFYSKLNSFWDKESKMRLARGDDPFLFPGLVSIKGHEEHQKTLERLLKSGGPAIVIAGSGMCTGGRIVDYLKNFLPDKKNDIIFIGYQASGTLGWKISNLRNKVNIKDKHLIIDGDRVNVNAGVYNLEGYSAHADQDDLVRWVQRFGEKPLKILLNHGEPDAKNKLKERLSRLGLNVAIASKKRNIV